MIRCAHPFEADLRSFCTRKLASSRRAAPFKNDGAACFVLIFAFDLPPSEARQAGQTA
jgi:hypothetical protein